MEALRKVVFFFGFLTIAALTAVIPVLCGFPPIGICAAILAGGVLALGLFVACAHPETLTPYVDKIKNAFGKAKNFIGDTFNKIRDRLDQRQQETLDHQAVSAKYISVPVVKNKPVIKNKSAESRRRSNPAASLRSYFSSLHSFFSERLHAKHAAEEIEMEPMGYARKTR